MIRAIVAALVSILTVQVANAQTTSPGDPITRMIERRAVEAAIWGVPAVNYDLMLQEMLSKTAGKENQVLYWSRPLDWRNQTLTPNPDALYFMAFYNTRDVGPVVIEAPPAGADGSLNANFVNVWQAPLEDAGLLGVDKGKGVKLLIVPPGYAQNVPGDYDVLQPGTYGGYALLRSNLKSHDAADVAASVAYGKRIKVYPLSQAANPPPTVFTDAADVLFDSSIRYDASFFDGLNRVVQREPWLDRDRVMIDHLKSLGIEKGKPFVPDARTKEALEAGVREAQASLEARYDAGMPPYWEGGRWTFPAPPDLMSAAQAGFADPNAYPLDDRGMAYSYAFVAIKRLGAGQFYLIAIRDKDGNAFDGGSTYRLTVPPDAPVEQYWSATAYDRQSHTLIRNMPRASRSSQVPEMEKNADGSIDVYFGPEAPAGKETNWVPTDPARKFEVMFRLYAPTKAFFDKKWRLQDIELLSEAGDSPSSTMTTRAKNPATPTQYLAQAFNPANADLARSAGVPAQLANEDYVKALGRLVYYWAYPAIDISGRTSMWDLMKDGPGLMFGVAPGSPVNASGCVADYLPPAQRIVVTPNNDTFYGVAFLDLGREPVVIQTPTEAPPGHYWVIQLADVFTNVVHTLGSAWSTPGGKHLLVGPDWNGTTPKGFIDVLRMPTNYGGAIQRSFAARTPEAKANAIAVLDQIGAYPLSQNTDGQRRFDCEAYTKNKVFAPGVTAEMIAADPDVARPQWVVPKRFWEDLKSMLAKNPKVGSDDAAMAAQARALVALHDSASFWKAILDDEVIAADASLHASARYEQVGVDAGNGWQRQDNGGLWGTDWFGRAQAAVVYILVNDYHEATYFIRGTDAKGALLDAKHSYTMTFPRDALPPVDRSKGGFWSLTMNDRDYFMLPSPANGRTNIGTVNLDANELKFAPDGSLTLTLARDEPSDPTAKTNWLPAPEGQFALIVRAYVPSKAILNSAYALPDVVRN